MLRLDQPFDERNEVLISVVRIRDKLDFEVPLHNIGMRVRFSFFGPMTDPEGKPSLLFPKESDYTFRDYGKVKNFTWRYGRYLATTRSHLEYIRNSPILDISNVEAEITKGRVYGLSLDYWETTTMGAVTEGALYLVKPKDKKTAFLSGRPRENSHDMQRFLDLIAEADVIGLLAQIRLDQFISNATILFNINDNDQLKVFLDKLITIYSTRKNMNKYLGKNKITLGNVMDNIDLYHCLSYGF